MAAAVYILRCADGSYYVGMAQQSLERRLGEHEAGTFDDAIAAERRLKGWSRAKKEAYMAGKWDELVRCMLASALCVLRHAPVGAAQDEGCS